MNDKSTFTTRPSETYFGVYRDTFRLHVHQLVAWGHEEARNRIASNNEQEPDITGYISEAIKDRLVDNCPPWCIYYSIHEDMPVKMRGRSGRSRPRPDIIIETNLGNRPEYIFEAKRLRKNGYGVDKYIDSDGMGCFISGRYAARYDEAAMLAYVQSDSVACWQREVRKAIDDNSKPLSLKPPQRNRNVIDVFPFEWISEHERISVGQPIVIYHILLDCCIHSK